MAKPKTKVEKAIEETDFEDEPCVVCPQRAPLQPTAENGVYECPECHTLYKVTGDKKLKTFGVNWEAIHGGDT